MNERPSGDPKRTPTNISRALLFFVLFVGLSMLQHEFDGRSIGDYGVNTLAIGLIAAILYVLFSHFANAK